VADSVQLQLLRWAARLTALPQFAINPTTLPPILQAPPPRLDVSAAPARAWFHR